MNKTNNEPAFPVDELNQVHGGVCAQHFGLTMRDYFAAKAMAEAYAFLLVSEAPVTDEMLKLLSEAAYEVAGTMMKAREA